MEDMSQELSHLTSKGSVPHKLIKRSFAAHRDGFDPKHVFDQMEINLTIVEEFFVNHIPRENNLLQFSDRYHRLGDMKLSWRPMLKNKKISS